MPGTQITIRNVDAQLARRLKAVSAGRGESLNATVLKILRDAVGLDERRERLRRYATWNSDDIEEFTSALNAQREVNERDWR